MGSRQAAGTCLVGDVRLAELRAQLVRRCEVEAVGECAVESARGGVVGDGAVGSGAGEGVGNAAAPSGSGVHGGAGEGAAGDVVGSARDQMQAVVGPLLDGRLVVGETARAADDGDLVWCAQVVQRAINVLEGARGVLAAEAMRRRLHVRRGEASSAEMLVNATAVGGAVARRVEREAQALDAQPQVAEALGRGEINAEQAAAVAIAEVSDEVRRELCSQATAQTADQTRQAVRAAEAASRVESDAQRRARQRAARSASMWTDPHDGMWHLRAKFDALTGDEVNRRLVRTIQQHWRSDKDLPESQRRSVPQRAADALAYLLSGSGAQGAEPAGGNTSTPSAQRTAPVTGDAATRDGVQHADFVSRALRVGTSEGVAVTPGGDSGDDSRGVGCEVEHARVAAAPGGASGDDGWVAPSPSQMIVVTTLDNLRGASAGGEPGAACTCAASGPASDPLAVPGAAATTETGTVLGVADARRIACDTQVIPVVMGGPGEVLDVGRAKRTIPPAIRRALIARDQGCVWPGCDRAPIHCDGHHIQHWLDEGPTSLVNLALLCHSHHQRLHEYNLVLHPPTGPAPPGQGWTVTPAAPSEPRTPARDHVRQNC